MATAEREELDAFRRYRAEGDRSLRNRLVESNLDLVEHAVRRYRGRSAAEEDLRQVASLALVHAVERFDPDRGFAFSTFAGRTIDGTIKRHFRDRTWAVRPPRRSQELYLEVRGAEEELTQELGRAPTASETADRLGRSVDEVLEGVETAGVYRSTSLDRPGPQDEDEDGGAPVQGPLRDEDAGFGRAELRVVIGPLLEELPEREQAAVRMRYVEERSQTEIAEELGLSQSYVSRLLRTALARLRDQLEA